MGAALPIRGELMPEALRRQARHEPNRRAALRMLAIVVHAASGLGTALVFRFGLHLAGRRVPRSPAALSDRPRG